MSLNENEAHLLCDEEFFHTSHFNQFQNLYNNAPELFLEKNIDGNLPLHFLCFRGMYISSVHKRIFTDPLNNAIELLLNHHPRLFFEKNNFGESPLHILAMNYFNSEAADIFKKVFRKLSYLNKLKTIQEKHLKNNNGDTPLHHLCNLIHFNRHVVTAMQEIIRIQPSLLTLENNNGNTPLHLLAKKNIRISDEIDESVHHVIKSILNKHEINPFTKNKAGDTPVHSLLKNKYFNNYTIDTIQCFFEKDILKLKDNDGNTPLHCMCMNPNLWQYIPHFFKREQLSASMKNNNGDTPLHILCFQPYTSTMNNVLEFLLPFKNSKNKEGRIPREVMYENENYNDFDFTGL